MIDRKLILANAPSNVGEQIHINHAGCPSGTDTKRRLYLKRTERGILAYCHHCNEKGFASDGDNSARLGSWVSKPTTTVVAGKQELPTFTEISIEGKMWLGKNYCDHTNKVFNGIKGDPKKVALDLKNPDQDIIGYQVRNLRDNATPKYITHYFSTEDRGSASWFVTDEDCKTLVITEDYLSAYRVNRDSGYSSVALLRTSLADNVLTTIYEKGFENIIIWLDPDEAGLEGTTKAYKKLNHFLPQKTVILVFGLDREPKQCTPLELQSILK